MKIFDSFLFYNELDLLELRLNILNDVVDYFVLSESPMTLSGNPTPLFYLENKERFSKFNHKIIHNITEIPENFNEYLVDRQYHLNYNDIDPNCGQRYIDIPIRYQRMAYVRDCMAYGLEKAGASDDDIVLTSDGDEIINPILLKNKDSWFNPDNTYISVQRAFYYSLNQLYQEEWLGTRVCTWKQLKNTSANKLRANHESSYKLLNSGENQLAGWHFSFFGNANTVREKIAAYDECQYNVPQVTSNMEEKMNSNKDPLNRGNVLTTIPLDDSYPEYIINNQEKYKNFIKPWN
jgi:beta-1,4-mannosyl-glycoprotein beta-1,4-N-acetylglucosaminyltransferase